MKNLSHHFRRMCLSFFATAMCPLLLCAYNNFEVDGLWYNYEPGTSDQVYVYGPVNEQTSSVVVPSEIKLGDYKYTVVRVEAGFQGLTSLVSVTLPGTIKEISEQAFNWCTNLSNINLPESLRNIEHGGFANCTSLKQIKLPSNLKRLGRYAFANSGLKEVVIPPSCTDVEMEAFKECQQLERAVIPNTWTSTGYKTFGQCYSLKYVTIPNSIVRIDSNSFEYCVALESIEIPNSVVEIADAAFFNCTRLKSVSLSNSLKEIGIFAFQNCTSLESLSIPGSVTKIDREAFENCPNIKELILEDGQQELEITFNCDAYMEAVPELNSEYFATWESDYLDDFKKVPFGSINTLYVGRPLKDFPFVLHTNLQSVTFGNVESINDNLFWGCYKLNSVTFSDNVKKIGERAFNYCHSLSAIDIPNSVTAIGDGAFENCSSLASINLSSNLKEISPDLFRYCKALASITLPESITKICSNAFTQSGLVQLSLPQSVDTIGNSAFYESYSLHNISLGNVRYIGESSFEYSGLRCVEIPASVRSIGINAYRNCSKARCIKVDPLTPPNMYKESFANYSIPLYVPERAYDEYCATRYWSDFTDIRTIEDGIPIMIVDIFSPSMDMENNTTRQIELGVYPDFATNMELEWTSSNEAVVKVDSNGVVTAVSPGEATVTCAALDGSGISDNIQIKVAADETLPVADGQIAPGRYLLATTRTAKGKYLGVDRAVLKRTNQPDESCCWIVEPQGDNVFHITNAVTGKYLMSGDCSLTSAEPVDLYLFTGQAAFGISRENDPESKLFLNAYLDSEFVTGWSYDAGSSWAFIPYPLVAEIVIEPTNISLKAGATEQPIVRVIPADAADSSLSYYSENPEIATVDENGVITGVSEGTTHIVVSSNDASGTSARCFVEVTEITMMSEIKVAEGEPEHWYDLYGRKVSNMHRGGIYISGGRKLIMK